MNNQVNTPEMPATDDAQMHRLHAECLHCGFEPVGEERGEYGIDIDAPLRRDALLWHIGERRGTTNHPNRQPFSSGFVAEQAAHRYFMLVETALEGLKGRFTEDDFNIILNAECSPIWNWDTWTSVAAMVADTYGVDALDDLEEHGHLRVLLKKLLSLTPLENAAVVDVCERIWRGCDNPLLAAGDKR
jgi:hypothetical protein